MSDWFTYIQNLEYKNTEIIKKGFKEGILLGIVLTIVYSIGYFTQTFLIEFDTSLIQQYNSVIVILGLIAFIMILISNSNKLYVFTTTEKLFSKTYSLIELARDYNYTEIISNKQKYRKKIIKNLKKIGNIISFSKDAIQFSINSLSLESERETFNLLIEKICIAISEDIEIPGELLTKIENYCDKRMEDIAIFNTMLLSDNKCIKDELEQSNFKIDKTQIKKHNYFLILKRKCKYFYHKIFNKRFKKHRNVVTILLKNGLIFILIFCFFELIVSKFYSISNDTTIYVSVILFGIIVTIKYGVKTPLS